MKDLIKATHELQLLAVKTCNKAEPHSEEDHASGDLYTILSTWLGENADQFDEEESSHG